MDAINVLKEPFPTRELALLDFGSADGRKDSVLEDAFVTTASIRQFSQNRHSIIIGPIGSGKSALFELLKCKSKIFAEYKDRPVVPIEEAISFNTLRTTALAMFSTLDKKQTYKLIWKFQITNRLCEELSKLTDFPANKHEQEIKRFLAKIKSKESDESILGKIIGLIRNASLTIKTVISESPISVEACATTGAGTKEEINLDRILVCATNAITERRLNAPLIIIDRIDTFVAGEDYNTQREYIEALLEVNDDIDTAYKNIDTKIFLRSDLFARLNHEALGYDKTNDNTLRIEWTDQELIYFIANRILSALKKRKLLSEAEVLLSTDLSDYHLSGLHWLRLSGFMPLWLKKKIFNFSLINQERDSSLLDRLNKAIVTKVFPRTIVHKDSNATESEIDVLNFLTTHFKDGHGKVTPRNLLVFLKQVVSVASIYYDKNPDQEVHLTNISGDWEWELFKKKCVYEAYCNSKSEYVRNISKTSNEWTRYFSTFLGGRGNKKTIDFNWVKSILDLDDDSLISFIAYLEHIGFLAMQEAHPDPKRRKYKIPIIYLPTPASPNV